MNPVLVLGAGRSSVSLLSYLNSLALKDAFRFSVADADSGNLQLRTSGLPAADALQFDAGNFDKLRELIRGHRIVISLLPPHMHAEAGRACLLEKANLITASYESQEMRDMAGSVREAGLVFLNECGLDPGIDHMSAMEMIHEIRQEGGEILEFHSYCGGLMADECDDNPFRYKISWNPRNVVLAGKSGGLFLLNGNPAFVPYHRLFAETEPVEVPGWGSFEAYPNRDSIPYASLYGLQGIQTLKRGTLRKSGFSARWNALIQAGMTDEQVKLTYPSEADYHGYLRTFFPSGDISTALHQFCGDAKVASDVFSLFKSGPDFSPLKRLSGNPSEFLLDRMVEAWQLKPGDKDLVVMLHSFIYRNVKGVKYRKIAWFGMKGEDELYTAMAKTVGLPLGITAKLLLNDGISQKGLVLPLEADIYQPVLSELTDFGVNFQQLTQPL